MTIYKALNYFKFRIEKSIEHKSPIRLNKKDIEAFNSIIDTYEVLKSNNSLNNELLFKMFIHIRTIEMNKVGGMPSDIIPQKEIVRKMNYPISYFVDKFVNSAMENKSISNLVKLGVDISHPATLKEDVKTDNSIKLSKVNTYDKLKRMLGYNIDKESVFENLKIEFTELLNKTKK